MANEAEVYFGLIGDSFDPAALTEFLGLEPTRSNKKGEESSKSSFWIISSGKVEGEVVDVYELSSNLVKSILPIKERVILAKKKFDLDAYLEVVLWIASEASISMPMIGFDSDVIRFLHEVGATVDIDTYRN